MTSKKPGWSDGTQSVNANRRSASYIKLKQPTRGKRKKKKLTARQKSLLIPSMEFKLYKDCQHKGIQVCVRDVRCTLPNNATQCTDMNKGKSHIREEEVISWKPKHGPVKTSISSTDERMRGRKTSWKRTLERIVVLRLSEATARFHLPGSGKTKPSAKGEQSNWLAEFFHPCGELNV